MEQIAEKSGEFKEISIKKDPHYDKALKAIPIIKEFIKEKQLIIYGGTAIDYALRLKGDNIYVDEALALPDLDFYSPDSVHHAYELADLLYREGFPDVRVIMAIYVRTMRIDIVDNHFLADFSYVDPKIFKKLPYIEYDGMRVIDPTFQKIDLHSSLSFPYDNPPREIIFARWNKDIERFNKMERAYPTPGGGLPRVELENVKISKKRYFNIPFDGLGAYALFYKEFTKLVSGLKKKPEEFPGVYPAKFEIRDEYIFVSTIDREVVLNHFDEDRIIKQLDLKEVHKYYPYMNLLPKTTRGVDARADVRVIIKSITNRYLGKKTIKVDGVAFRVVSIQYLLMHFLVMAHLSTGDLKETYYSYYHSLMRIIKASEKMISEMIKVAGDINDFVLNTPFFPSVDVFGTTSSPETFEIAITRLMKEMKRPDTSELILPVSYYPARGKPKPKFNYEDSKYFIKDGSEITRNVA